MACKGSAATAPSQKQAGFTAFVGLESMSPEDYKYVPQPNVEVGCYQALNCAEAGFFAGGVLRAGAYLYHTYVAKRLKPRQIYHLGRRLSMYPSLGGLALAPMVGWGLSSRLSTQEAYEWAYLNRYDKYSLFRHRTFLIFTAMATWASGVMTGASIGAFTVTLGLACRLLDTDQYGINFVVDARTREREIRDHGFDPLLWPKEMADHGLLYRYTSNAEKSALSGGPSNLQRLQALSQLQSQDDKE